MTLLFQEPIEISGNIGKIESLFKGSFPRFSKVNREEHRFNFKNTELASYSNVLRENDSLLFKSASNQVQLLIGSDSLHMTFEGDGYENFERTVKNELPMIHGFFKALNITAIQKCSLRKINLMGFTYGENNPANGALNALLNKGLSHSVVAPLSQDKIKQNMHFLTFQEDAYVLELKYGMNTLPSLQEQIGQLIVDLNLFANQNLPVSQLDKELELINNELFNVFAWMLNEETKKEMNYVVH